MSVSPSIAGNPTALRGCWHPVAYSRDLQPGTPLAVDLLSEPVVVWRDSSGLAHALRDVCIHRGTALSLGSIQGDEIVCAYHGWRYAVGGACTAIPQLADPTRVPAKARVAAFPCIERYEMIWVALDEPRWPLPEVPELGDREWRLVLTGPFSWRCDASRQIENFTEAQHPA